jgi:hypothetical protein
MDDDGAWYSHDEEIEGFTPMEYEGGGPISDGGDDE